jgi:hypothetical protein
MTKRLGYTYAERPIIPSTPLPLRIPRGKDKRPPDLDQRPLSGNGSPQWALFATSSMHRQRR